MSFKRLPRLLSVLVALSLFALAAPVAAQSARALLAKGNKLFAAGDYQGAFAAFSEGNKKKPSPSFLRSMAFCKLKLYQHKDAQDLLTEYLKKYKRAKDAKKLSDTLKKLDDVVATTVMIESTPPGADIYIDAEAAGRIGQTPKKVTIEPGTHTLILKKAGFSPTTKTFTVKAREAASQKIALEVPLVVTSDPAGADVFIDTLDGKSVGKTPLSEAGITLGKHKVFVKAAGYKIFSREVDVTQKLSLAAKLALGLRIDSDPAGAMVSIDGTKVEGVTPVDAEITPGAHKISLTLPGFKDFEKNVTVVAGTDASFKAELQGGLLSMRTGVTGAKVMVGGLEVGKTPLARVAVPMGSKVVKVEHPDRRGWSQALDFNDTTLIDANVTLGKPAWPFWVMAGTAAAAGIAGGALGIVSLGKTGDYEESGGKCGVPGKGVFDQTCPYATHDASTGLLISAGVVAVAATLYYFLWMRPSAKIERKARAVAAARRARQQAQAKLVAVPQTL